MANVRLVFYKSHTNHDGKHPVKIRIIQYKSVRYIKTGQYLFEHEWDDVNHCVSKRHPSYKRLNYFLSNKYTEILNLVLSLETKYPNIQIDQLVAAIEKKRTNLTFFRYTKDQIEQLMKNGQFSLAKSYESTLTSLRNFHDTENLLFEQITPSFLQKWENWYLKKQVGNKINGLNVYKRNVRAIFNDAIEDLVIDEQINPFIKGRHKISQQMTRPKALRKDSILTIRNLNLSPDHSLFITWKIFLFIFYCRGINFRDLSHLKWEENITDGRIEYTRRKTKSNHKGYSIKIEPQIAEILEYFKSIRGNSKYIFPIITETEPQLIYHQISSANALFNLRLKELASMAKITINLTSYVARYSWATIARDINTPLSLISEGLGHMHQSQTVTYLDKIDTDDMDMATRKMMEL